MQTLEALSHARAAGCPIILALTKCDMPNANVGRVKNQLLSEGLLLEEAGGNVLVRIVLHLPHSGACTPESWHAFVQQSVQRHFPNDVQCACPHPVSLGCAQAVETAAPKGVGLAELEEAVLLQAELMDLKASRTGAAEAVVVEARMDKGQGPVATVIVNRGMLQVCAGSREVYQGLLAKYL